MTARHADASRRLSAVKQALLARRLRERDGSAAIPRRTFARSAPLAFAQEPLWVLETLTPGSNAYNVPVAGRLCGTVDDLRLGRALQAVVDRHEALRTTFVEAGGEPMQVVRDRVAVPLRTVDLRAVAGASAEREAEARRLLAAEAALPFDLAAGPLLRALLVRLSDADALLTIVVHHIVFDGASVRVLLHDLARAYDAESDAGAAPLAPLALQFPDVAAWQRTRAPGADFERGRAYWAERLAGAPPPIELPADRPRSSAAPKTGARRRTLYPEPLACDLDRVARAHDATPFMLFVAAFAAFLSRYGGGDDLVIGTPVAGRARPEVAGLIGAFAHALPLRVRLGEPGARPTFAELLRQVRATCLGAYEHQDVPYERQPGGSPFSVLLLLGQEAAPQVAFGGATLEPLALDGEAAPFDLVLSLGEEPDGLRAALQYPTALWDAATIDGMLARFGLLLREIADHPGLDVARLALATRAERDQLLRTPALASGERDFKAVHELVDECAQETPDAASVRDAATTLSYAELARASDALARRLRARGIRRGTVVGVHAQRAAGVVVAMLGILKSGAAYLPLDPKLPAARLRFMVGDAACALVLTDDPGRGLELGAPVLRLCGRDEGAPAGVDEASAGDAPPRAAPEDLAYIVYTSGSTGAPKGVGVPHRALGNYLRWMRRAFALGPADRVLQRTAFGFDAAVWVFFAPLVAGATVVLAPPSADGDPFAAVAAMREHAITVLESSPSFLGMLLEVSELDRCTSLRQVICGGEALPRSSAAALVARLPVALANLYGPTEACIAATFHRFSAKDDGPSVPIGRPIDGVAAYVLDEALAPCPAGVPGELFLAGAGLALGYVGRPDATAAAFATGAVLPGVRLYRTGDRVVRDAAGDLRYLGRRDRRLKLRGYRIEPGEIEAALVALPGVREAAVTVAADPGGEPQLIAYVRAEPGAPRAPAEWRRALGERLPAYMLPAAVMHLEAFPRTANGKLDYRSLPAPDVFATRPPASPPRTALEAALAPIVAEVLGLPSVGPDDDFFALGGHSLGAMRAVARIGKLFRADVSLRRFFERPTVGDLAAELERAEKKPGETAAIARALAVLQAMPPAERARRSEAAAARRATGPATPGGSS